MVRRGEAYAALVGAHRVDEVGSHTLDPRVLVRGKRGRLSLERGMGKQQNGPDRH